MIKNKSVLNILLIMILLQACNLSASQNIVPEPSALPVSKDLSIARTKIKHIIIIMQENRSFDEYFGTYPGADGIPMQNDVPIVCAFDPQTNQCIRPYHDPDVVNVGGPHSTSAAAADINGGKMDGFITTFRNAQKNCSNPNNPVCVPGEEPDVMGWHDAREIPNYWAYAQNFVLQDHMFQPNFGPSEPAHLYMVSGWSATCRNPQNPGSCVTNLTLPDPESPRGNDTKPDFGWTDLTYLLHKAGVNWAYYTDPSERPDCDRFGVICGPEDDIVGTPNLWNPLPDFVDVHDDGEVGHIKPVSEFFRALKDGSLPPVVWVVPNAKNSEHPPAKISDGQAWVTSLINAVGRSSVWDSSAIFVTWDDWGGFYDHVVPPATRDGLGYSMRVPALLISPYARKDYVDHHTLSFDD